MADKSVGGVAPGEHPLMSNKTLRAMYAGMVKARGLFSGSGQASGVRDRRAKAAAFADVACWASVLVGLTGGDIAFGCRRDGVLAMLRGGQSALRDAAKADGLVVIDGGVARLYAAIGAAMAFAGKSDRVAVAFFERHEAGGQAWAKALQVAAELPLVLVVLPRWKGRQTEGDLCREARTAGVPGIAVDGYDAVAIYRVAQESIGRAKTGGGAALIEGVRFQLTGRNAAALEEDAVAGLGTNLLRRGVATQEWMDGVARGSGDDRARAGRHQRVH